MSIEIGSKWVKDGEVVEICDIHRGIKVKIHNYGAYTGFDIVFFKDKINCAHCMRAVDFLEQYKPYKIIYEYKFAFTTIPTYSLFISDYMQEEEFNELVNSTHLCVMSKRLDFTKRERKQ